MKKTIHFIQLSCLIFVFLLNSNSTIAQTEKCGFDRLHQQLIQQPAVQKALEAQEKHVLDYKNRAAQRTGSSIVTIPVVVHVFHCGEAIGALASGGGLGANLPDDQIISAITDLNEAFSHTVKYSGLNGYTASTNARFALAQRDPNGNATNGIIRKNMNTELNATDAALFCSEGMNAGLPGGLDQLVVKAVSTWPAADYMNVWLVHKVENGGTCSGTLGFASFPGTTPGTKDGLTVLSAAFGYDASNTLWPNTLCPTVNRNGTADHEVGHYLNLFHTFEGDGENPATCPPAGAAAGDKCGDIPPHKRSSGCPAPCTTCNDCDGNGPNPYIRNFMDYVDDICYHGFSNDQKTRIDASIAPGGPRAALNTSLGGTAPSGSFPVAATCTPAPSSMDAQGPVSITLNGTTWISSTSNYDGGSFNRVASQATAMLTQGQAYTMSVTLASAGHCNLYIDYDNDGAFTSSREMVYTSTGPNISHSIMFTPPATGIITGQRIRMRVIADDNSIGGPCAAITYGQAEDYSINISMVLPVTLTAFNARTSEKLVKLDWKTSSESNNNGFEIQRKEEGTDRLFQTIGWVAGFGTTIEAQQYAFTDQQVKLGKTYYYRLKQIDFDGQFEFSDMRSATIRGKELPKLEIFPNPASNKITIFVNNVISSDAKVKLYTTAGQLLHTEVTDLSAGRPLRIDLSTLPNGIYLIQVSGEFAPMVERVMINN